MAYGLWLALGQSRIYRGDFSATNKLTGTIYTDKNLTTAKNLTGYTITVRIHRKGHYGDFFNKTADIVTAGDGTWSYAIGNGELPPRGIYWVKVEISKSGDKESTLNRVELHILEGPN